MKKLLLFFTALFILVSCEEKRTIRIACIGDSITYGAGVACREENSYPRYLGKLLGDGYSVENFGVSATTLLNKGDYPYTTTEEYQKMLEFRPDVVFIKLGTNDSKTQNRKFIDDFESDYNAIIDSIRKASPDCRVVLLTPVKAHNYPDTVNITPDYIRDVIAPKIKKVAFDNSLEVLDLYPMFADYDQSVMPDKIHPSSLGTARIAMRLYEFLNTDTVQFNLFDKLKVENAVKSSYHGFNCYSFDFNGKPSVVVTPKHTAKGAPWVWRARFWGHEPQTDIALLERGFHLVYNEVGDMFGSPKAVEQWDGFYKFVTEAGLNPKCAIEGMSRGGLITYNFAAEYPERVAAVYVDAPVLDLKSWPMNKHGESVVPQMLDAYGFKSVEQAKEFKGNPIDKCEKITKGGFKMLHICGDADEVVPMSENSTPFVEQIKNYGGDIKIVAKPGIGHHPHSLSNPKIIVDFILKATGHYMNTTKLPTPGCEYRSGAGWIEGNEWSSVSAEIASLTDSVKNVDLILLGNSITQGFGGERKIVTYKPGKEVLDSVMGSRKWISAGISGDRTETLLYRILNDGYGKCAPKYATLTIGINNLGTMGDSAEDTAEGVIECVKAARKIMPETKIILYGALPAQAYMEECKTISEILASVKFDDKVVYVNPFDIFTNSDGTLKTELYGGDMLHLNQTGYEVWADNIAQFIE